jgi:hypothetical protein
VHGDGFPCITRLLHCWVGPATEIPRIDGTAGIFHEEIAASGTRQAIAGSPPSNWEWLLMWMKKFVLYMLVCITIFST